MLSRDKCSIQKFLAILENTSDEDVTKFLYLFTNLKIEEIKNMKIQMVLISIRLKIILANEVTKICHGEKESKDANKNEKKFL